METLSCKLNWYPSFDSIGFMNRRTCETRKHALGANGCVPPLSARVVEAKLRRTVKWMQKHPTGNWIRREECAQILKVTDAEKPFLRRWFKVKGDRPSKRKIRRSSFCRSSRISARHRDMFPPSARCRNT